MILNSVPWCQECGSPTTEVVGEPFECVRLVVIGLDIKISDPAHLPYIVGGDLLLAQLIE